MAATSTGLSYNRVIHTSAKRELESVPVDTREDLKEIVREASQRQQPTEHPDVRPMRHADNLFRVRAGKYRALCDLQIPRLRVLLVDHRGTVYDRTQEAINRKHG